MKRNVKGLAEFLTAIDERATGADADAGEPQSLVRVLRFTLGDDELAVPVDEVREVCRVPAITPVFGARPGALGVANVRGVVTAILDLAQLLGRQPATVCAASRLLVLERRRSIGLLVDGVLRLDRAPAGSIAGDSALAGSIELDGRRVLALDLSHLFAPEEES